MWTESENAADALRLVEKLKPDLVLTDISLPGRNGIELIKDLRSFYPDLPVLVLILPGQKLRAVPLSIILFYSASDSDRDTAFGFTVGLGVNYNISPSWFVGAEGKYLFTSDVTLFGVVTNLNGIIALGVIGYRF